MSYRLFGYFLQFWRAGPPVRRAGPPWWRAGVFAILAITAVLLAPTLMVQPTHAKTIDELRADLESRKKEVKASEERIKEFQANIATKRQQAQTLAEQITLMDQDIEALELTLTKTQNEISQNDAAIEEVVVEIEIKEKEIAAQKILLSDYLRAIHEFDQQSSVAIFFKYTTFSEALTEVNAISELQTRAHTTLLAIQTLHQELMTRRRELEDFKQTLEALRLRQADQQKTLDGQRQSKQRILNLTNAQESQYRSLLQQAQAAHKAAETDIRALDAAIREELRKQGLGSLPAVGVLDWPVNPIFGISCGFHCAGYPYAYLIGPHSGIDIPTYAGTPIKAPADGYVARTHDSGGPGYNYILMLHGENVSTVYGHISGFAATEGQLVTRGTVIGYTGGAPGTRGAGLSSGPHLHFEVRVNNTPVNGMKYLGSTP